MAVNLAEKYSGKIAERFTVESFVKGKTSKKYDFDGVKGIKIYTPTTVALNDYNRSGSANRYGTPQEMQDTIQAMLMTQDKSFSLTIDKGNNSEQMMIKNAGRMMSLEIKEQCVPTFDKYAMKKYVYGCGQTVALSAAPTKSNIVENISSMAEKMDDKLVTMTGRTLFVRTDIYNMIRLSTEFVGIESLGAKSIGKGEVGEILGFRLVKVPKSYLPTDCYALAIHSDAVLFPFKLNDSKVHQDPPGVSGALLEGRFLYDAFVIGAKADAVVTMVLSSKQQAAPTFGGTAPAFTLTSTGADTIKYTTDGSDPRYSDSAKTYSASVTLAATATVKAAAFDAANFTSDVAESTITVS